MTPRTLPPAPVHDRRYWRLLLRQAHPDAPGGSHDLFLWTQVLREHVAGDAIEESEPSRRREPPKHPAESERVDFSEAFARYDGHAAVVEHVLEVAESIEAPFDRVLGMLRDLYPSTLSDHNLTRAESVGVSYKQAAYISRLAGFDAGQRIQFYRLCERLPLSQRCGGHLISRLQQGEAA